MVNFFDKIYSIEDKYSFLRKLRIYSAIRFSTRILANILIPAYFRVSNIFIRHSIELNQKKEKQIIVSLTSFPQRINRIWIVIESIIRQKYKPDRIILWLSLNQFKDLKALPKNLIKMQKRGLEIRLCEDDLRSHKKYYYAMQEFPKEIIITIDDDVIYNSNLITYLVQLHKKHPSFIICNHASEIRINGDSILPYKKWKNIKKKYGPTNRIMPIGVGGVLYPPGSLHSDVFDIEIFKKTCFNADDIWLNFMAHLKETNMVKSKYNSNYLPVINLTNSSLNKSNIETGQNDKQLADLRNYYINIKNIDLLYDLINNNHNEN
jgi:hypothetical protein